MSQQERDRLDWLKKAREGLITQVQAAEKMGVTDRWVRELLTGMKQRGDAVVVQGLTGRSSNRKIQATTRDQVMGILKQPDWHDFGPTFASEQLAKRYSIQVSDETVRKWMIEGGLWKPGSRRVRDVHIWRPRRSAFGELTQWDTSDHDWLEGRGPVKHLVRLIDDATSESGGRFVERDTTPFNMMVLWEYLKKHGRMVDVYTDRDSMFTSTPCKAETQIGRALRELGIGWIPAHSPQAKGRVERSFRTDQDRLVKQLRLAGIRTLEAANAFLETEYWPEWNAKFARPVADFPNQHRPLTEHLDLAAILCHVEQRVVGNDYTFSFAGQRYQIARAEAQAGMRHQRLRVELRLDGELKARYEGRYLNIAQCGAREPDPAPAMRKPVRKDHNAGGKSSWMDGFCNRPSPPLWRAMRG
ncbi:MAG: ISNCY family transposase [Candidatus Dormibacteraceae bacterium]